MNDYPQAQFQFIKTYFLKSSIAIQIKPDSLDDINSEILDEHSTNNSQHRRIKSDFVQNKEAQKFRFISQQQYSQQTETSTQNQSFISQGILKKSQRSLSNKTQKRRFQKKKVHFI